MRRTIITRVLLPGCLLSAAWTATQQSDVTLRIAAPTEDTFVQGPTRLVAKIDPPASARRVSQVTFFVEGQKICTLSRAPYECDWDAGERIKEYQIRAVATLRDGGRLYQNVRTKGIDIAESVDVDVIQITAVVTDGDGRFVKGLTQKDFTVYEDDRPQPISFFASENIPLELVAALDVSSSMEGALSAVKESAKRFLAGMRPRDQVTLLAFNDIIFTLARRETDQEARERAIDLMAPWGGTALHDVIIRSADLLGRQSGRRSILLFSDGDDQSSIASLQDAIRRIEASDATIYAIGQGRAVHNRDLQQLMRRIANVSGGRPFFTEDQKELDVIFTEILEDLRNQYFLTYPAPSSKRDGQFHKIRLQVGGGKYKVRTREGYRLLPTSERGRP
jgi:Ca-activated chloride channel family protein